MVVGNHYSRDDAGEKVASPVIVYYGAGRAWIPSRSREAATLKVRGPVRRWEAFYDCFQERIRSGDLRIWFQREAIAAANRGGRWRPGYEAVRRAVVRCIPEADDLWYDGDRQEIVLSIAGQAQPFSNLSAGQRMMAALVADVATKAVMQNSHLITEAGEDDPDGPAVLQHTPGMVLVDELDVHLHPKWQRRVVRDLKETFPKIQFVCTSHSPSSFNRWRRGNCAPWFAVFDQHVDVRLALIEAFPETAASHFDEQANLVGRPGAAI